MSISELIQRAADVIIDPMRDSSLTGVAAIGDGAWELLNDALTRFEFIADRIPINFRSERAVTEGQKAAFWLGVEAAPGIAHEDRRRLSHPKHHLEIVRS